LDSEIYGRTLRIIARAGGVRPDELEPGTDVFEEGYLDSFAAIALVVGLAEEFGLELDIADISREQIASPKKTALFIEDRLRK
jgi:acyl carrier protein